MNDIARKLDTLDEAITALIVSLWGITDAHKDLPEPVDTELQVIRHRMMHLLGFVRGMKPLEDEEE